MKVLAWLTTQQPSWHFIFCSSADVLCRCSWTEFLSLTLLNFSQMELYWFYPWVPSLYLRLFGLLYEHRSILDVIYNHLGYFVAGVYAFWIWQMHIIQASLTQALLGNYDPSFLAYHLLTTSGEHLSVKLIHLCKSRWLLLSVYPSFSVCCS